MNDEIQEVETEEVNVLDLLSSQGEEVEEAPDNDEYPDDLEELKALLKQEREIKSKRNKSLKISKQSQHRTQEENDALLQRLDDMERKIVSGGSDGAGNNEQLAQEWREKVDDNPVEALAYADQKNEETINKVAGFLEKKFGELEQKLAALQGATDPEKQKYAKQMEVLRNRPGFSDFDDDTLLKVAKGLEGTSVRTPRSTIGGQRGGTKVEDDKPLVMTDEMRIKMGFEPRGE